MKRPCLWGGAWLLALCAPADAELVFSTIAQPGSVLPGGAAGEVYTASSVDQPRAWGGGKVYFWAKATSSLAIAGTREGIWSWQNGAYTLELLEGDAVAGGGGGLQVGKFDANGAGNVIANFTVNPSGALLVSVRLRGGNTNGNTDRAVIYHKTGVNTLLQRSASADVSFSAGISRLTDGAAYTLTVPNNGNPVSFLFRGLPVQGIPSISFVASEGAAVPGEAGSTYNSLGNVSQGEDGSAGYFASVQTAGGDVQKRLGVKAGGNPSFPCTVGTAVAGTGGALTLGEPLNPMPAPGNGWWFTGRMEAGGADLGVEVPFLFRDGSLTSLFPGGTLAGIFGEDGSSTGIQYLGGGPGGDLAITIIFSRAGGGFRVAVAQRSAAGAFKLILEQGKVIVVDGSAHAVTLAGTSTQPFASDGTLALWTKLDGNPSAVLLAARETTAPPTVRIESPRRHRTTERRITFRGTASDDGSVTQVRYRVNRVSERAADGTTRWNFTTPRLREGRNRIVVQAVDGDGGLSAPARFIVRYMPH